MLSWFQKLMPKEERFFDMFEKHARTLTAGADILRKLLEGGPDVPRYCQQLMDEEHKADDVAREVLLAVRRTFITPIDRGDIKELITLMDDSIDQMQKTAKTIQLFEVNAFEPHMRAMGDAIVESARLVSEIVPLLRAMHENASRINAKAEKVTKIEEQADHLHDEGVKALFNGGRADPMSFIIGTEIFSHLEKVVDRFEDVANRVSGIVIEHV
jgi:predicted phosphate transport protein (TIGR00153 family)